MNKTCIYKIETPLHVGSGNEIGVIDMPIQREKHTGFPKIEASSIKGVYRASFEKFNESIVDNLFGEEKNEEKDDQNKSCKEKTEYKKTILKFSDARILLFPVKTARGVFGWVTCPFIINRFINDMKVIGECNDENKLQDIVENNEAIVLENSNLINQSEKSVVILEDFMFKANLKKGNSIYEMIKKISNNNAGLDEYIKNKLEKDVVIVSDEVFSYFVNMSTEVNTRIKIGKDGVVEKGHLFTEEYVPAEAFMYSFIKIENETSMEEIIRQFKRYMSKIKVIQIGGNETLGKGIAQVLYFN